MLECGNSLLLLAVVTAPISFPTSQRESPFQIRPVIIPSEQGISLQSIIVDHDAKGSERVCVLNVVRIDLDNKLQICRVSSFCWDPVAHLQEMMASFVHSSLIQRGSKSPVLSAAGTRLTLAGILGCLCVCSSASILA
jgi:hypothetical protein